MIANMQLNSPQLCVSFVGHKVVGIAAESKSLKLKAGETLEHLGIEFSEIFVLLQKGVDVAKVISLKVDCFGLQEAN